MRVYETLAERYSFPLRLIRPLDDAAVKNIIVDALDAGATKLERVNAMVRVAPQAGEEGLRLRLFKTLADEDFPLAAEIVIEATRHGAFADDYLGDQIARFGDREQLRRAVGALAACGRELFSPEFLVDENFCGVHAYEAAIAGMNRLIEMDHAVDEVRSLAQAMATTIEATANLDCVRPETLSRLRHNLAILSERFADRPVRPGQGRKFDCEPEPGP